MKHLAHTARQFLDIEAEVDNGESENEEIEQDLQDLFINESEDEIENDLTVHHLPTEYEDEDEDEFWNEVLERSHENSRTFRKSNKRFNQKYSKEPCFRVQVSDFPLWRVECKLGSEEQILISLLNTAEEKHGLRSAFTPGTIRGAVYLECDMNPNLISLLERTLGISRTRLGIRRRIIDPSENTQLLKMESIKPIALLGDWVEIRKGLYKGDVGRVLETYNWGVDVILVPRLAYKGDSNPQKRKASTVRPPPDLLDDYKFQTAINGTFKQTGEQTVVAGRLTFHYGLVKKSFDYHSLSPSPHTMPWNLFSLFHASRHPDFSGQDLPRPQEWTFEKGDKVIVSHEEHEGEGTFIKTSYATAAVRVPTSECTITVNWHKIWKVFVVGNFVRVAAGPHSGCKGWILELSEETATIVDSITESKDLQDKLAESFKRITAHVNCLIHSEQEFRHSSQKGYLPRHHTMPDRHPWHGINIVISKHHHGMKGKTGQVIGVTMGQATTSGMRLEIQLTEYDPAVPFKKITVDYDDVVEITSLRKLHDFKPLDVLYADEEQDGQITTTSTETTRDMTPAWDPSGVNTAFPLSPAWDPSSRTPLGYSPAGVSSSHIQIATSIIQLPTPLSNNPSTSRSSIPKHILLNTALRNFNLTVTVNGGGYNNKELTASICETGSQLSMRYIKNGTSHLLQPEWVIPKHPSPTHDNGLLAVIKGKHCGKYLRRLHHRKRSEQETTIILAVVNRLTGMADEVTGERLELTPDYLCKVDEPKADRERNKNQMMDLRRDYVKNAK